VWAAPCLFISREARRTGVSRQLLRAAVEFAAARGATSLEGYPLEPRTGRIPDAFAFTGLPSAFRQAGFQEVARPSSARVIMQARLIKG
jgi:GNAT superfamily N-acetyltransferase